MKNTLFIFATLLMTSNIIADDNLVGNKAPQEKDIQKQGVVVKDYQFQQGDTILINEDTKTYLTGEEISNWVYYVRHIVKQNGGKRFPNGILIQGINSWVDPSGLMLFHAVEQTPEAIKKQEEDRVSVVKRQEDIRKQQEEKVQPVKQEEKVQPVKQEEKVQPVKQEEKVQPVKQEEKVQPVKQEEKVQPVKQEEKVQPVKQEEQVQPAKEEEVQPAKEEEVQPAKDETISENPVEETVPALVSEIDRFSIGLRGGVASMMHKTMTLNTASGAWKPGFDVILDLQYAHYWQKETAPQFGILTGLSVGYNRSTVTSQYDSITPKFTDIDGDQIQYTYSGKSIEKDGQVMLEVPLMFSMVTMDGFFMNIGPRVQVPVYSHYKQTITDGVITLDNISKGVSITNEPVTGALGDKEIKKGSQQLSVINVLLSAELGYEFKFKNNNSLGLGVYANYGVYSLYKNEAAKQLFSVVDPAGPKGGITDVNVLTTTKAYTQDNGLGFFDCGVKLNYNFDWVKR